jgi:hypothetical protein
VDKAADKGGKDGELGQGSAVGDVSHAGECRVMDKWDVYISFRRLCQSWLDVLVPLSLVTKH